MYNRGQLSVLHPSPRTPQYRAHRRSFSRGLQRHDCRTIHGAFGPIASLAIDTNTVWHLRSITSADGSVLTIEDASLFTVTLTDDGKVNARADCNRASGGYRISGNVLSIGPIALTKAYCATAPVDQQFLILLGGENIITTSDAALQLSSRRGTLQFGR